jgi:pimeloyl-ACP methyl ester carboxylesterase
MRRKSMQPHATVIDITDQIPGLSGTVFISALIFAPCDLAKGVLFCVPGDSKAYYHLVVPGFPEEAYSFALFMAKKGWLVITVDPLGTGESTRPTQDITTEMMTCANEAAFQKILACILEESFDFRLPRIEYPSLTVCIGHGKGAMLALAHQARYRRFDTLAVLGWSNYPNALVGCEATLAREMEMDDTFIEQGVKAIPPEISRVVFRVLRPWLFSADVPSAVINAYAAYTTIIWGLPTDDCSLIQKVAALIDVPIFLCLADDDIATNLPAETATYPWSPEILPFHLFGSAHFHNFATTRELLWTHLDTWFHQILDQCVERKTETDAQ